MKKITILIVHANNMVVRANDVKVSHLKEHLTKKFEIKDFGSLRYFLRTEMSKGIIISQR